jgi:hypothetical protein
MTEQEWLVADRPGGLFRRLRGRADDRRLRLFTYACWHRLRHLVADGGLRRFLGLLEPLADGLAPADEIDRARRGALDTVEQLDPFRARTREQLVAANLALWGAHANARTAARQAARTAHRVAAEIGDWAAAAEDKAQCDLLRDVFGNPFRPVNVDPAWLRWNGGAVRRMARTIYDERRFADLPILADALEEAGCGDEQLLSHCRGGGEHVRGCFAVDCLLGDP